MIKKMDIGNFGVFKGMIWNSTFGENVGYFNKINIIYGENYSGKTTFSRIFDSLKNREIHPDYKSNVDLNILCDNHTIDNHNINEFYYDLMVYNSDFIEKNLKWLIDENSSILPFTIIGEKSLEIHERIEIIKKNKDNEEDVKKIYESNMKEYFQKYNSLKILGNNTLTNIAKEIRTNQQLYGKSPYDRTHLSNDLLSVEKKHCLDEDNLKILTEQLKDKDFRLKNETENIMEEFSLNLIDIQIILDKVVTSAVVIDDWKEDNQLANWIDEAYKIHKSKYSNCQFCGGEIAADVFTKIENHFTKESLELDIQIDEQIEYINGLYVNKDYNLKSEDFVNKEYENIVQINNLINQLVKKIQSTLEEIKKSLSIKKQNHFNSVELSLYYTKNDINQLIIEINKLYKSIVANHNEFINNAAEERNKIKNKIYKSKVFETKIKFIEFDEKLLTYDEYQKYLEELNDNYLLWKSVYESSQETVEYLSREENEFEKSLKDEQLAIKGINDWINYFFNDETIQLDLYEEEEKTFFRVLRNDKIAKNLSEGERRIISFCYYLTMLQDKIENGEAESKLIVYIDDPISSLDHNHVFSIFSSIDSLVVKNRKYHQLFISTHSLEFLKYLNRLDELKEYINYYYITKTRKETDKTHKSYLSKMPTVMRDFSTEYQFLFDRIYQWKKEFDKLNEKSLQGKIDNAYTNFYDLPNIMRRFLEIHLFYNDPGDKSLATKVSEFIGDETKSIKINRIVNEFSHTTVLERAMKPITIKELEHCVDIVLSSLESNNESQFNNLKNSVSIKQ